MRDDERAYLTVISWPDRFSEAQRVAALAECVGITPYQARLAARRNTPGIMREMDVAYRDRVLAALHRRGVLSIAPTQSEIDAYPEAQVVNSIEQFPDADPARFVVAPKFGGPWSFTSDQAWLIVGGRLRTTKVSIDDGNDTLRFERTRGHARRSASDGVRVSHKIRVKPVIDLHVRSDNGDRVVRLIGSRTRVGIVGDSNRPCLLDNTPPLDLIEAIMPGARVDREFLDFDPPPSLRQRATKWGGDSNIEKPHIWSFYSSWLGLIRLSIGD